MLFVALTLIDIALLFFTFKSSALKNARLIFSLVMCGIGVNRMIKFPAVWEEIWVGYFDRYEMPIPNQLEIQFSGVETIEWLYSYGATLTASVIVAFIILTIVLRRFDGNIDRAVRLITLGAILITVFAPIVMGFLTIIRIPYFAVVMLTESVSFAAVISPALCTFNNVCIGKKEYGYRVDSLKTK